jgi:hypothetical protein
MVCLCIYVHGVLIVFVREATSWRMYTFPHLYLYKFLGHQSIHEHTHVTAVVLLSTMAMVSRSTMTVVSLFTMNVVSLFYLHVYTLCYLLIVIAVFGLGIGCRHHSCPHVLYVCIYVLYICRYTCIYDRLVYICVRCVHVRTHVRMTVFCLATDWCHHSCPHILYICVCVVYMYVYMYV